MLSPGGFRSAPDASGQMTAWKRQLRRARGPKNGHAEDAGTALIRPGMPGAIELDWGLAPALWPDEPSGAESCTHVEKLSDSGPFNCPLGQ